MPATFRRWPREKFHNRAAHPQSVFPTFFGSSSRAAQSNNFAAGMHRKWRHKRAIPPLTRGARSATGTPGIAGGLRSAYDSVNGMELRQVSQVKRERNGSRCRARFAPDYRTRTAPRPGASGGYAHPPCALPRTHGRPTPGRATVRGYRRARHGS